MRAWTFGTLTAAVVTLAACEPPAPAVPPGSPVAPVPMKLMQRNVSPEVLLVEVKADGMILGPSGQPLGKIQGTKVVDGKGKDLVSIAPDGTVTSTETD